jgi:short-subunit dehydrogenase
MLNYRTALITGASRGLGAALARELGRRGLHLALVARDVQALRLLAAELRAQHGIQAVEIEADLVDPAATQQAAAQALAALGSVDVLVNNAGAGSYKPLGQWRAEEIAECNALNLTAPMLLCHALVPAMAARGSGYVINVASDLARRYLANMAPYVATKFGLLGFSGSLQREVKAQRVKVTTVMPGIIDTAFGGAKQGSREPTWSLDPAELAERIAALLDVSEHVVIDELTIHPLHQDF